MKNFIVTVPIVGYSSVFVEAENEEVAKEKALDICCDFENESVEIQELSGVEKVVEGNVCHHPYWSIDIMEED